MNLRRIELDQRLQVIRDEILHARGALNVATTLLSELESWLDKEELKGEVNL